MSTHVWGNFNFRETQNHLHFFPSQCVWFSHPIYIPFAEQWHNNVTRWNQILFTFDFGPGRSRWAQVDLCIKHFFRRRPIRGRGNTIILTWDLYTHLGGEVTNDRASFKVARETREGCRIWNEEEGPEKWNGKRFKFIFCRSAKWHTLKRTWRII